MTTALDSAQMPTIPTRTLAIEEAMRIQRAMHRLKPNPVDDVLAKRLIELALKALTSLNVQTWEFVMVKDRQLKARLNRLAWAVYGCIGRRMMANDEILELLNALKWGHSIQDLLSHVGVLTALIGSGGVTALD